MEANPRHENALDRGQDRPGRDSTRTTESGSHYRLDRPAAQATSDPVADFRSAMTAAGLAPPDAIVPDGALHRFHIEGDRIGTRNGWYCLFADQMPAGVFGSWKTGASDTWCAKSRHTLTHRDRANLAALVEQARRQRDAEQAKTWESAATRAAAIWDRAQPASDSHPYLVRKCVRAHGTRQTQDGRLVVPVWDGERLTTIQYIDATGDKRFLTGGRIKACSFPIGEYCPGEPIAIGEGFSTCAALHQETGALVLAAFSAGNLLPVARRVRDQYPDAQLVIAGDNDAWTPGNPGRTKAIEAARAVRGRVLIPMFSGADLAGRPTDWNDWLRLQGRTGEVVV